MDKLYDVETMRKANNSEIPS